MKLKRNLTPGQKKIVLNRDGWCCNKCGFVPFYRFENTPQWARRSYESFWGFARDIQTRKPIIIVKWVFLPDAPNGGPNLDFSYLHGGELQFDHIIPIFKGGSTDLINVQALCKNCHDIKSNSDYRYTESKKYAISKYTSMLGVVV